MTPKLYATFDHQIALAVDALVASPQLRNQELSEIVRAKLLAEGCAAPKGLNGHVIARARAKAGVPSRNGRPVGSKNKKTLERQAAAETAMKAIEAETTRSLDAALAGIPSRPATPGVFSASTTGIFTGTEVISMRRGPVPPTLTELLQPVAKLMRERGISRIELDAEGLRIERTISESVVL